MKRRVAWRVAISAVVTCVAAQLVGPPRAIAQPSDLAGQVSIDGSSTVFPISVAVANMFRRQFPNVRVKVALSGTTGGFRRFIAGETDISDASRPIKPGEFDRCKEAEVHFVEVPVAFDGLSIVVHRENDWCRQLKVEDLKRIFFKEKPAQLWSDLNSNWPEEKIVLYAPGLDSGTMDYFREVVADEGALRPDILLSEDDNLLATGVAEHKHAIAFFGCAYYFKNQDKLRAVSIVNPDTGKPVAPAPKTIASGEYAPFSRPLFIYVNARAARRPEIRKFVEFYLAKAEEAAQKVGYVPLPPTIYQRAMAHFKNRQIGTHFLSENQEKQRGSLEALYTEQNRLTTLP